MSYDQEDDDSLFGNDRVRRDDMDTSREAAAKFTPKRLSVIQARVLWYFGVVAIAAGSNDMDLEDFFKRKHPAYSTVRKRRTELEHKGYVRDSGRRNINRNNSKMAIWEITESGKERLEQLLIQKNGNK